MNLIENNFKNFLPLNRKERFFTGTVLPQILCYNSFKYIDKFFSLIPGFPKKVKIDTSLKSNNIQFLTEYNLKESYCETESFIKYNNLPQTKDTPDLVILITKPEPILIVLEAKMYGVADVTSLNNQMKNQERNIITYITSTLEIKKENVYHAALIPKKMIPSFEYFEYKYFFWEDILDAFASPCGKEYFYNVLKIALDNYDRLVSQKSYAAYPRNPDTKMTGEQIAELYYGGKNFLVGRSKGFLGDFLRQDKLTGGWKTFPYEVNFSSDTAPNSNWFTAKQFINFMTGSNTPAKTDEPPVPYTFGAIKAIEPKNNTAQYYKQRVKEALEAHLSAKEDPALSDPWHFSHLGKDFFLDIAGVTCKIRSFNVDLETVYIGATGEPYIEKTKGRKINPTWYAVTKDGQEYKGGPRVKGLFEIGTWKKANCKSFNWEEIKDYYCKKAPSPSAGSRVNSW
ncbi:MAG: hypothetical protein Q8903_01615 [Bacteroidota bacterium]|nr:hypothetical protein [Bacteroidota bacterium]